MVKRCACFSRFLQCRDRKPKKETRDSSFSINSSVYSKDVKKSRDSSFSTNSSVYPKEMTVRIIHAGGCEELYENEIPVSELMGKYPGMCLAKPEVFKYPHESLLSVEEKLLPGHKYFLIPSTTIRKLKRKHSEEVKGKESTKGNEVVLDSKSDEDSSGKFSNESDCSAKDFYVSREKGSKCYLKKGHRGKKQFVPPIRKRIPREFGWEPSLKSIEEISP